MKKTLALVVLSAIGILFTSCGAATRPIGAVYAEVSDPVAVSGNPGSRKGEATSTSYFGLVALGDGSIEAAKRAGGISTVSSVDVKRRNILGIISTYTTIVHGN